MEEESVSVIRETNRSLLNLNRRALRDEENDERRSLGNTSVTTEKVADIANRLKSKSQITVAELQTLKNVLINDANYINIVLSENGALRGLVREISGTDVRKQVAAAGCCCNLALGDSKSCTAVAKAAGPYLLAALDNLNTELAVTCAWSLGNLAGSGPKVSEFLVAQGALTKLTDLLSSNEDLCEAALYALVHFAYQLGDSLSKDHLIRILDGLFHLEPCVASTQLVFILSCHEYFDKAELHEAFLQKLLKTTIVSTRKHVNSRTKYQHCEIVYLYRTLANMIKGEKCSATILNYFLVENISDCFSRILQSDDCNVVESLMWLLGMLYKYCSYSDFFNEEMIVS